MSQIRRRPSRPFRRPGRRPGFKTSMLKGGSGFMGATEGLAKGIRNRRPSNVARPRPGVRKPGVRPGVMKKATSLMGAMGSGGNPFTGQMFAEGGEAKKYPNKGLEALAKEAPEVVERMGYKNGGMVASCPHRGEIQGVGNVDVVDGKPRGTKFVGTR